LVVSELGSNVVKHASSGTIQLRPLQQGGRNGLRIECDDNGSGIDDPEQALTDGYSTSGSLGIGLGTVNRLMDDLELSNLPGAGLRVICHRWVRPCAGGLASRLLEFGVATRPCRGHRENGDAFVIKCWEEKALTGILDGLGHGPLAQRAAQAGRQYLEQHFDQPLDNLFRGVERACRATRGVVMALARFDLATKKLTMASVGNIEVRLLARNIPVQPLVRRGVLGLNAPNPVLTEHLWTPDAILMMHSDGLSGRWRWDQISRLANESVNQIASELLLDFGKSEDDVTVLVVTNARGKDAA